VSSPVHHPDDLDPALMYAPRRVRAARSKHGVARRRGGTDRDQPQFDGDRAMLLLRRRLSLDPQAVPEPPQFDEGIPIERIALRLCLVACIGALIGWAFTSNIISVMRSPATAKLAAVELTKAEAVPELAAKSVKLLDVETAAAAQPAPAAVLANADEPARPAPHGDPAGIAPSTTPPAAAAPVVASIAPALGGDDIARLLEQGKSYLSDGDIASARLLLRRAAEAGSAEAALVLGSTFDPRAIARLGAIGVSGDLQKARKWYRKAAQLGSPIAARQLASLADR
jgi:hypothetical protein